jgi:hypothetical protein
VEGIESVHVRQLNSTRRLWACRPKF